MVSALNTQLDDLRSEVVGRGALGSKLKPVQATLADLHEEQSQQVLAARERQIQNETYVNELRGRVAKLSDRNSSSEVSGFPASWRVLIYLRLIFVIWKKS